MKRGQRNFLQLLDDRGWCAGGHREAKPGRNVKAGKNFPQCRHVGKQSRTLARSDRQQFHPAFLGHRQATAHAGGHQLQPSADQICPVIHVRSGIRRVDHLDAGALLQHFHGQVGEAELADGGVAELSRLGLGSRYQIQDVVEAGCRRGEDAHRNTSHDGNGCEVVHRIVGQVLVEHLQVPQVRGGAEENQVPILRTSRHGHRRDRAGCSRAYFNHHRLPQARPHPFGHGARYRVNRSAG